MIVYCIMGAMAFSNASRRTNARNFVTTRLVTDQMWEPPITRDLPALDHHHAAAPTLYVEFRFLNVADRDSFWTDLVAGVSGAQGPTLGSWLAKHDCGNFNDPPIPCVETERLEF